MKNTCMVLVFFLTKTLQHYDKESLEAYSENSPGINSNFLSRLYHSRLLN